MYLRRMLLSCYIHIIYTCIFSFFSSSRRLTYFVPKFSLSATVRCNLVFRNLRDASVKGEIHAIRLLWVFFICLLSLRAPAHFFYKELFLAPSKRVVSNFHKEVKTNLKFIFALCDVSKIISANLFFVFRNLSKL